MRVPKYRFTDTLPSHVRVPDVGDRVTLKDGGGYSRPCKHRYDYPDPAHDLVKGTFRKNSLVQKQDGHLGQIDRDFVENLTQVEVLEPKVSGV